MSSSSSRNGSGSRGLLLLLLLLLTLAEVAHGARSLPAGSGGDEKREQTQEADDGTVLIPGLGRVAIGGPVVEVPSLPDLDHSAPAAESGGFLPGADDTFIPNPGFEIPNPGFEIPNPFHP